MFNLFAKTQLKQETSKIERDCDIQNWLPYFLRDTVESNLQLDLDSLVALTESLNALRDSEQIDLYSTYHKAVLTLTKTDNKIIITTNKI